MGVEESRDPCMSYRIEADESLEEGVRRVADEQIEKALDSLDLDASESTEKAGEAIHDARKRMKKTRSLLRLARAPLGDVRVAENDPGIRTNAGGFVPAGTYSLAITP